MEKARCINAPMIAMSIAEHIAHSILSPGQTRKHCFLPMFRHVSQSEHANTIGNISEKHRETSNVSEFARSSRPPLLLGKQILFSQQCFHGWANRETFEETSRITIVSATMFPSLPRA
jgi:hypothetical protein